MCPIDFLIHGPSVVSLEAQADGETVDDGNSRRIKIPAGVATISYGTDY